MEFEHKLEYFVQSRGFGNDGTPGFNLSLDLFGCRGARRNPCNQEIAGSSGGWSARTTLKPAQQGIA